jgi:hypothetical protein
MGAGGSLLMSKKRRKTAVSSDTPGPSGIGSSQQHLRFMYSIYYKPVVSDLGRSKYYVRHFPPFSRLQALGSVGLRNAGGSIEKSKGVSLYLNKRFSAASIYTRDRRNRKQAAQFPKLSNNFGYNSICHDLAAVRRFPAPSSVLCRICKICLI